jgi:hypothetical protein
VQPHGARLPDVAISAMLRCYIVILLELPLASVVKLPPMAAAAAAVAAGCRTTAACHHCAA